MNHVTYQPVPLNQLNPNVAGLGVEWVWGGLLARGDITLLTSVWKSGKTTLLAGLLDALDTARPFLGRPTVAAHTVIVSEESPVHWAERQRVIPGGARAAVVTRPFPGRPSAADWQELVATAEAGRAAAPLDLFVIDPLATFLPGRSDSDPAALLDFLHPLRQLAAGGTAVLVLHHPRKERSEEGSTARGSGALLGYVDTTLELARYGRLSTDANRRRLSVRSRHPGAPEELVYEWAPGTPDFRVVADGTDARFRENWEEVRRLLAERTRPISHRELLGVWPEDRPAPSVVQLYEWLHRAVREGWAVRSGKGTKGEPYRFALPPKPLDYRDLPPLRPL